MAEFKDANIILHELEQLFNRDDDIKDILDIRKMQSEIEAQCAAHLKSTKEIIRGKTTFTTLTKTRMLMQQSLFSITQFSPSKLQRRRQKSKRPRRLSTLQKSSL